tara:strand:- start:250 stop:609 length:360 start_codon:yes stop_codon:yes gene_type:complete
MDYSRVERNWGHYKVLYEGDGFKVKELVINPHSSLSMQRHQHRSETWNLVSGSAYIKTLRDGFTVISELTNTESVHIPKNTYHQGCNDHDQPAHIIEIWKGEKHLLSENDIERIDNFTG